MSAIVVTPELCFLCFEALANRLTGKSNHVVQSFLESQGIPPQKFPLFVTWTKQGSLRGCIGTFSAQPLLKGLQEYALTAALRDDRFRPMQAAELASLECEVSLLHSFERCQNPLDWEVGVHGTDFEFGRYSSTFLPEVAEEQKWTKEETLKQLARKAGLKQPLKQSDYPKIVLQRYQSAHLKVTWNDYQTFVNTPH
jgi:uncharacterized protein (TIGR00296 family)